MRIWKRKLSRRRALPAAAAALAALALVLAGCQSSGSSGSQSGGNSGADQRLTFATPAAGAQVTSPVKVSFNVTGTEIGEPETGKMHLHVHVDNASEYKILYATQGELQVPQGSHTLKAVLAQPNHSETSVTATQKVEVSGGGQAPGTTAGGNDSGGGYGNP